MGNQSTTKSSRQENSARPAFRGMSRVSPTQYIREVLLNEVLSGTYKPGEMLPSERALCEMFEVSRVSVREAIAGLDAMGVIKVQQGRGAFVVGTEGGDRFSGPFGRWLKRHREQMVELLKVRGALDELAAFETARIGDPAVLSQLDAVHKQYKTLGTKRGFDLSELVEIDMKFHSTIAQGSGSELLVDMLSELSAHIADSRRQTFLAEDQPARSIAEHQAILDAIKKGDPAAAKRRAGEHIDSVRSWLETHL